MGRPAIIEHRNGMTSISSARDAVAQMARKAPRSPQIGVRELAYMRFAPSLHGHAESLVYRLIVFDLGGFVADLSIGGKLRQRGLAALGAKSRGGGTEGS